MSDETVTIMKQVLQSLKTGETELASVPIPNFGKGALLIRTRYSLVSAGTERMLLEFGKANWLNKARQQPDKVRMVLDKARADGLAATIETVQSKLDQPLTLGYCNVGTVIEVGRDVHGFAVGDRVVSNGAHAEWVAVPANLCAKIPNTVSDEEASFTVLAAIGLQGVRLAAPTLGECVVVTGLGLIGLLTVQLLRAQGCRVLGIDFDAQRRALASRFGAEVVDPGAEDAVALARAFSRGRGVDAVIITASTSSNEPVSQAAKMCRKRGRIVLVGVTGLNLSRADFYEKELTFQVSCSYGPGRYDPAYEEGGQDYPLAFVRWTEQRNFEAVLDMMASRAIDVASLITHRFTIEQATDAFGLLTSGGSSLGIILEYGGDQESDVSDAPSRTVPLSAAIAGGPACVGLIGAGNYAGRILAPAFKAAGARLRTVVSGGGVSAVHLGRKLGFEQASTDLTEALSDPLINTLVIATRHSSHSAQVLAGLEAGKHIFCEKPLCLTLGELAAIEEAVRARPHLRLMVGFNRRFARHTVAMKRMLDTVREPKSFIMTVNAGDIPADHWTQARDIGGGRIIGEACHFIDLLRHLAGSGIIEQRIQAIGRHAAIAVRDDKVTLSLTFADGSIGTIHYLANGHKAVPKERLEVFCAGRILQLDNFRKLRGWGWPGFRSLNLWSQDKGQAACVKAFVDSLSEGGAAPIPLDEILEVTRISIDLASAVDR